MTQNIIQWLANGERGISSNTIFTVLTEIDALGGWHKDHPYDPADFRRCRLLLEQCPQLKLSFNKMQTVSREWAMLFLEWDNICKSMDEETPQWKSGVGHAPKTYEMIKAILERAKQK